MNNNQPTTPTSRPALPTGQVLVGDAVARLRRLPGASVDCVVTSPPYFLLRNYGVNGQIGHEDSVHGWVDHLLAVLAEVARVLKPGGAVWLNLGDTYARHPRHGALPKGLVLGPERLLIALSEAGWMVRNKVVWAKPNPMPTSVRDRLSTTWEPLYMLTRTRHYTFDLDAIRVPAHSKLNRPAQLSAATKYAATPGSRPDWSGPLAGNNSGLERMKRTGQSSHPLGKNPGDVWTIPTASYRGAHFATFPQALVERPLLATCPERVCRTCGTAWSRVRVAGAIGATAIRGALRKSCTCTDRSWEPGVVLDPFFGAGTVGVVANRLHRQWIGIELNPTYAALATKRIAGGSAKDGGPADEDDRGKHQRRKEIGPERPGGVDPLRSRGDAPDLERHVEHQAQQEEQQDDRQNAPHPAVPLVGELRPRGVLKVSRNQGGEEERLDSQQRLPRHSHKAKQTLLPPPPRIVRTKRLVPHQGDQSGSIPSTDQPADRSNQEDDENDQSEHRASLVAGSDNGDQR